MTNELRETLATRFVGRRDELDVTAAALDAARSGKPQVLLVEGEPGIGKTAFVRRCLATADDMVVIEASGDETETTLEFGIVTQLLVRGQAKPGTPPSHAIIGESPPSQAMIGESPPSQAMIGESPPPTETIGPGSPASAFSVGGELLRMLGSLQDEAPVLIAVDDAHWIDASSAAVLLFTLRRLHGDRVLVLIATRPQGLDHLGPSWPRLVADTERVGRISLGGLTSAEVTELADSMQIGPLTLAASERLREHTGGHPLYVKALLSEMPADTLNFHAGPLPAPRSFAATVLARLTNVSSPAQSLVASAAVAGVRCQLAPAASVAGLSDPIPALEEALAADLLALVPDPVPEEITFPHPLLRAAVRDDLSPARRRALHLSWAEQTAGSDALAHRAAASGGSDDDLAAELRIKAEAEIAAGRLTAGVERLLWSSRIAGSPAERELALLLAVECLMLAGEVREANSHRDAVLRCSDSPRRSFVIGALTASVGLLPQAEATLLEVVARPDFAAHPELEGAVASSLAIVYGYLSRGAQAIQWARRAMKASGSSPTVEVTARQALVMGLTMEGRGGEAIAELEHLSASRIDPAPFEAELLATRGNLKAWWGDLRGATEDLWAVIGWSRAGVSLRSLPNAYSALAEAEYRLGRWDDGLAHAEVAVSLAEDFDRSWDLPFAHAAAAHLYAGRGNWRAAAEHVEGARRAAERAPLPIGIYYACDARASVAWVRTEWDLLLSALEPLDQHPDAGRALGLGHRIPRLMQTEALICAGDLEQATSKLQRLEPPPAGASDDVTRVEYWRVCGELERALERPDLAERAFARGAEVAGTVGSPFYQALLELSHGRFLHKTGSRRRAIAELRTARRRFESLGARPFVGRCDAELAACGVRARAQGTDDHYGLTAREEVVARLVASGKSNREVAEELYLSTKAIEYHLTNVFAKVNVRSRRELAARLNAFGTQPPT